MQAPLRVRASLDKTPCSNCETLTFDIAQNTCNACSKIICFKCAAIKRNYCCSSYVKRFWPGLMSAECEAVNAAIASGDKRALRVALNNFGLGATDDKIAAEISMYNARHSNEPQGGCRECHSEFVTKDGELCHPCIYWFKLAESYGVTTQIIRIIFKEWNPREYPTFKDYMASFEDDSD